MISHDTRNMEVGLFTFGMPSIKVAVISDTEWIHTPRSCNVSYLGLGTPWSSAIFSDGFISIKNHIRFNFTTRIILWFWRWHIVLALMRITYSLHRYICLNLNIYATTITLWHYLFMFLAILRNYQIASIMIYLNELIFSGCIKT